MTCVGYGKDFSNLEIKYKISYRKRLQRLVLTTLLERRKRGDLIETFKIMEFLIMEDSFQYFFSNSKFTVKTDFKN